MESIQLIPNIVWSDKSYEKFCKKMVPVFPIEEFIPAMIKRRLEVIQKLIAHSYYEYDFIDVALVQSFQTLELALHLKYTSRYPNKKLKNLKPYLDWAIREKVIPISDAKLSKKNVFGG